MSKHERTLARYPVQPHCLNIRRCWIVLPSYVSLRDKLVISLVKIVHARAWGRRQRLAEEADKAVKLAFVQVRERRKRNVNYFVAVDDVEVSSKILRRPSANNPDFTDVIYRRVRFFIKVSWLTAFFDRRGQIEIFTHVRSKEDSTRNRVIHR